MTSKKLIKKEIKAIHWTLLVTSKLLIGIGIGMVIASHFWHSQPYWFIVLIIGATILIPTLYHLTRIEAEEEKELKKKLKKKKR